MTVPVPHGYKLSSRTDVAVEKSRLRLPADYREAFPEGSILKAGPLDLYEAFRLDPEEVPLADPLCLGLFPVPVYQALIRRLASAASGAAANQLEAVDYLMERFRDCPVQAGFRVEFGDLLRDESTPERTHLALVGRGTYLLALAPASADAIEHRRQQSQGSSTRTIVLEVTSLAGGETLGSTE